MQFSIIIAIYNRSDELQQLLDSLCQQSDRAFEVLVIDDGSSEDLAPIAQSYQPQLALQYHKKSNSGPGLSRNYGAQFAQGEYLIFLDSDCITPPDFIQNIRQNLAQNPVPAWGGQDKAHPDFNHWQKAISYAMTSLLTTGGVRGNANVKQKFQPRSFNMGVKKEVFVALKGFSYLRIGEDPDLSMRLWENGHQTALFSNIAVYHKRRSSLGKFAKQVYQFGVARPILNQRHPAYTKLSFFFPTVFLLGLMGSLLLMGLGFCWAILLYGLYFSAIFVDAFLEHKNLSIAAKALLASAVQLLAYGWGFLRSFVQLNLLKQKAEVAFPGHFHAE
jgi:glycosyltransferase involved in cell wall biosynthesis